MTRIEFTTACQDAPGVPSLDFGQPRAVTHGRSASVLYPREDGGTTICDTHADVASARRLGAQLAFKDSMGLVISRNYAYDPTKTEVLGMDERITTESSLPRVMFHCSLVVLFPRFSGLLATSQTVNHPRRHDPNTSPDHSIGNQRSCAKGHIPSKHPFGTDLGHRLQSTVQIVPVRKWKVPDLIGTSNPSPRPANKSPTTHGQHGRTSWPATDPDPDHRPETRTVRVAEMSWLPADPAE
ncbi:hypothetical protein YC2023_066087 [Brassica napus]